MIQEDIIADILACLRGEADSSQLARIEAWLKEDKKNYQHYQDLAGIWYRLHFSSRSESISWDTALGKARKQIRRQKLIRASYWMSGIAACFAVVFMFLGVWKQTDVDIREMGQAVPILSGEKKAILKLADGREVALSSDAVTVDLGGVVAVGDSVSGLTYRKGVSQIGGNVEYNTLMVPRGGEYILTLSDGTKVWLNSETELKYPVVFVGNTRQVYVEGEAYFDVAKDTEHPFIVTTPSTQTIVRGTVFNVMAYQDQSHTEITLVQGAVTVKAGNQIDDILPGEQACINNHSLEMTTQQVNVSFFTSWKDGLFDFDGMTLEELSVQLSRWYDIDFFFVHASAGEKKFTGAVKRNNSLRFMLEFIEKTSDVRFDVKGKTVRVYNQ